MFLRARTKLVITLLLLLTLFTIRITKQRETSSTKVCIAMLDDRFTRKDFEISRATSISDFKKLYSNRTREELGFIQTNMLINKLYALKHGYDLILSDMSEYQEFLTKYPKRHPVWLKPNFVLDILNTRNDCDWVSFMDSDAHFWMDHHHTSLDDFFSTATMMDGSMLYQKHELAKVKKRGYYPWKEQDVYFIIGMNGIFEQGRGVGWPYPIHSTTLDAACAGVFLVKNNEKGSEMMYQWIYGPEGASQEILDQYDHFAQEWAREQSILNRIIIPLHTDHVAYYSYRDFVDPDASVIRHIWTVWKNGRDLLSYKDLQVLLPFD